MAANKTKAVAIAVAMGSHLENEKVEDCGVALGILLGRFSMLFGPNHATRCEGIDAIAGDAKAAAKLFQGALN